MGSMVWRGSDPATLEGPKMPTDGLGGIGRGSGHKNAPQGKIGFLRLCRISHLAMTRLRAGGKSGKVRQGQRSRAHGVQQSPAIGGPESVQVLASSKGPNYRNKMQQDLCRARGQIGVTKCHKLPVGLGPKSPSQNLTTSLSGNGRHRLTKSWNSSVGNGPNYCNKMQQPLCRRVVQGRPIYRHKTTFLLCRRK